MDISQPIKSVIPSLDGPVLAALAATSSPITLTEVHRLAERGSLTGVRRVLLRLCRVGVVHDVPGGFVLNRDHLAATAIEVLAGLHGELARRIGAALDEWGGEIAVAGIYGSAARRDGDDDSDIDVLVVSDSDGIDDLIDDLPSRITTWTGNRAHVVGISRLELRRLRREKEPILAAWERELVVVRGDRQALKAAA